MWFRKHLIHINGVSRYVMNALMQIKKMSLFNKGKELNSFVLSTESFEHFLAKLKNNLQEIQHDRFQVAVKGGCHWWMIDFYIKNGELQTFTLDAGVYYEELWPFLEKLSQTFPVSKHFTFYRQGFTSAIQSSQTDCPWFTREHISLVSQMDPEALYNVLQNNTRPLFIARKRKNNISEFRVTDLNDNMVMLAPLFRNMQSMSNIEALPTSFKRAPVTKNASLEQWVENNKVATVSSQSREKRVRVENHGIVIKEKKFLAKLFSEKKKFTNDRSGFGYITFPILTRIKQNYLQHDSIVNIRNLTLNLITQLESAPKTTKLAPYLGIKAKHAAKTHSIIQELIALYNSNRDNKAQYINDFCEIIYNYAGYLDKRHSDRTLKLLKECFIGYEKTFQQTFSLASYTSSF